MGNGRGDDPVQRAADGETDLYDVATWEERTRLDAVATWLYGALVTSTRAVVIALALLILLGQVTLAGAAVVQSPTVAVYIGASLVPAGA
ncbi:MAG: PrsW family intramembrane metalloprotease, partial [Halanaeroarchaeum sp.]